VGAALISGLLPEGVRCAEAATEPVPKIGDPPPTPAEALLFPEEAEHAARFAPVRRAEFAAVRACARAALGELGFPPAPILPGPRREPTWPDGVRGSMTHCEGYCAAAVALAEDVLSLGIDAEVNRPLPDVVTDYVTSEAERDMLAGLARSAPVALPWETLLFSAKESVYKTWFPLTRRWLGFEEAEVELDPAGTFTARLLVPAAPLPELLHGRWAAADGLLATAIALPGR
jgi:4'-phosphopantetheinyl transferase EntD